jgi:SAM-dependent methyltransferase
MGKYITRVEEDFISQCLAEFPEKPEIILDTAAGSGRFEPVLTKLSSWVIATEAKPELMLILAQMGDNVLPILVDENSECLPVADSSVDYVVCIECPSLAEQTWFYAECHRVLKPKGIVIISVTNRHSYKGAIAILWPSRYRLGPQYYYENSLRDIKMRLEKCRFTIKRQTGFHWAPLKRDSDSALVGLYTTIEDFLKFSQATDWSPWVLLEAQKVSERIWTIV